MVAIQQATITEFGGDSPKRMPLNGIVRSERIGKGDRGEASCEFETKTLRYYNLLDPRGYWLYHDHGDLGLWGGVIQQVRHDLSTGTTEVAGQTFESLLDAKRTAKTYEVADGDAGGIAQKVIADSAKDGSAFITGFRVAPTGLVDINLRSEQVVDVINQLSTLADADWRVTPQRYFEFAPRIGTNRSTVALKEGTNIGAGSEIILDLSPIVNDLAAMTAVTEYTRRTAVVVRDDPSIEQIGQRQGTIVYSYLVKESALRPAAKKELQRLLRLGRAATIEVLNVNHIWSAFSVGDTVRLLIPSCNVDAYFRPTVRTWSSDDDKVFVTGEFSTVLT
jgi:hypothetical protein